MSLFSRQKSPIVDRTGGVSTDASGSCCLGGPWGPDHAPYCARCGRRKPGATAQRFCPDCGQSLLERIDASDELRPHRSDAIYCSTTCRKRAWRRANPWC